MDAAHVHLIFCHIPIVGAVFTILLILFGIFMKSKDLKIVSLWFSVIVGLFSVLAYVTGDGAAETAKKTSGITESIIEPHEEWALYYFLTPEIQQSDGIASGTSSLSQHRAFSF